MINLSIGIPAHGISAKLVQCIERILTSQSRNYQVHEIIITNSGSWFSIDRLQLQKSVRVTQIQVPPSFYWSKSVATIYKQFYMTAESHLLLMNHDCYVGAKSIDQLVRAHELLGKKSICHSLLVETASDTIWWAGTKAKSYSRLHLLHSGKAISSIGSTPIITDSTMGQCLLLPRDAINHHFLMSNFLPHYFSDSVQTSIMRRKGFILYVIPTSVSYTDQSDQVEKLNWLTIRSVADILRIYFHPKSSRNLCSVFIATWLHYDTFASSLLMAFYESTGKIVMTLIDAIYLRYPSARKVLPFLNRSIFARHGL